MSLGDQGARGAELHARADAVLATLAVAEPVGELLAEPALDPLGGDQDELLLERVGQWVSQQLGEALRPAWSARGAR